MRYLQEHWEMSEQRACGLVKLQRSSLRYERCLDRNEELRKKLKALAEQRPRFGHPRLYVLLRREGYRVNHKRTERLYRELSLSLRRKRRKKIGCHLRIAPEPPKRPNERWSMDFIHDQFVDGRRFKCLVIVDDFTRECPVIAAGISITGVGVANALEALGKARQLPPVIVCDNGPEFAGKALDEWAHRHNIKLDFIRPGKPVENAYIESFNGKFRDECLNEELFYNLEHAKLKIEAWRRDYNQNRPHQSLDYKTPEEFMTDYQMTNGNCEVMSGP